MWITDEFPAQIVEESSQLPSKSGNNSQIIQTMCEPDFISNNELSKCEQRHPKIENLSSDCENQSEKQLSTNEKEKQKFMGVFQEVEVESDEEANFSFSSYNRENDDYFLNQSEEEVPKINEDISNNQIFDFFGEILLRPK